MADGKSRCVLLGYFRRAFFVKLLTLFVCLTSGSLLSLAADSGAKPILKVAPDGFPSGRSTPEGTASDLARAFTATAGGFTFGVCAAGVTAAVCSAPPGTVPKAVDVITPAGVSQATELDPTVGPVVIQPVVAP